MNFTSVSKTSVIGNGIDEDSVVFADLPNPTFFRSEQLLSAEVEQGAINEWVVTEGTFEATFNPPGEYSFVLSAEGFETYSVTITALEA